MKLWDQLVIFPCLGQVLNAQALIHQEKDPSHVNGFFLVGVVEKGPIRVENKLHCCKGIGNISAVSATRCLVPVLVEISVHPIQHNLDNIRFVAALQLRWNPPLIPPESQKVEAVSATWNFVVPAPGFVMFPNWPLQMLLQSIGGQTFAKFCLDMRANQPCHHAAPHTLM